MSAADQGLAKTTTLLTKDAIVPIQTRGLTATPKKKENIIQPTTAVFLPFMAPPAFKSKKKKGVPPKAKYHL